MGRLDGVIANAGFVTIAPLVDMTLKQYDELQRVAQYGAFVTLREGARPMVARAQGGDRGGSLRPPRPRAHMVCAGPTKTEMVPFDDSPPFGKAAIQKIPLGRMADPDEIAGV